MVKFNEAERKVYEAVTGIVRNYCARHLQYEDFLLVTPQRQISSSIPAALQDWQRRGSRSVIEGAEEDVEQEPYGEQPLVDEIISQVSSLGDLAELRANDSKFNGLREVLVKILQAKPQEKVVLFSSFRPTLVYLHDRLEEIGIKSAVLMGARSGESTHIDKHAVLREFESPQGPNVLLSSEVGAEGIDLQFSRFLINYDLPWNPMRVEQRIGRIDRLGQKSPRIWIWNLFTEDTIDARIYNRLHKRLKIFERALGGLEAILGETIRKLTFELLSANLTPKEEEERIDQATLAIINITAEEERLEQESASLIAHEQYIIQQIHNAREMSRTIKGDDLKSYVFDHFRRYYAGSSFHQTSTESAVFEISLSDQAKLDLAQFIKENRESSFTKLISPSPSPVKCMFDNNVTGRGQLEVINQFHPLVRFVTSQIKKRNERFYPAVSASISRHKVSDIEPGQYVFTIQRWSVAGIQERDLLYFKAVSFDGNQQLSADKSEKLVSLTATEGTDWLEARTLDLNKAASLAEGCMNDSDIRYKQYILQLQNENDDRADIQERTLESHVKKQLNKLQETRAIHLARNRIPLVKATDGKISALNARLQLKKLEIASRRNLLPDKQEVCAGIIEVN